MAISLCRLKTGKSILLLFLTVEQLCWILIILEEEELLYFASGDPSRPGGRHGCRRHIRLASLQTRTPGIEGSAWLLNMFTCTWQPVWGSDLQLSELFNNIFLFHWVRRRNYCQFRCCTTEGHALFLLWFLFDLLLRAWFTECPLLPVQSTASDHIVCTLWSFRKAERLLLTNVMYERTNTNCISQDISTWNNI